MMPSRATLPGVLLVAALATAEGSLHAQLGPAPPAYGQVGSSRSAPLQLAGGGSFESYSFDAPGEVDIESIRLLTLPVGARIGVARGWELQLSGAWARADLTRDDGSTAHISGPTDTEVRLITTLGGDLLALTAVAVLPTGRSSLTEEEADVAAIVAADVLPFRISNWGTGGGLGLSAALAGQVGGGVGAGVVISYLREREFEPFDQEFTYRPGHQFEVRGVLDRTFGTSAKASLQAGLLRFDADQADGSNFFQSGSRLQGVGSLAFAVGPRSSGIVYVGAQHRQEGNYVVESRGIPLQDLVFAGAGMRLPVGGVVLQPTLDLRNVTGDETAGTGTTVAAGLAAEIPVGGATWIPSVRGRLGEVGLRDDRESAFTGIDMGLSVRFGRVAR
jgi:hypothetical protein